MKLQFVINCVSTAFAWMWSSCSCNDFFSDLLTTTTTNTNQSEVAFKCWASRLSFEEQLGHVQTTGRTRKPCHARNHLLGHGQLTWRVRRCTRKTRERCNLQVASWKSTYLHHSPQFLKTFSTVYMATHYCIYNFRCCRKMQEIGYDLFGKHLTNTVQFCHKNPSSALRSVASLSRNKSKISWVVSTNLTACSQICHNRNCSPDSGWTYNHKIANIQKQSNYHLILFCPVSLQLQSVFDPFVSKISRSNSWSCTIWVDFWVWHLGCALACRDDKNLLIDVSGFS